MRLSFSLVRCPPGACGELGELARNANKPPPGFGFFRCRRLRELSNRRVAGPLHRCTPAALCIQPSLGVQLFISSVRPAFRSGCRLLLTHFTSLVHSLAFAAHDSATARCKISKSVLGYVMSPALRIPIPHVSSSSPTLVLTGRVLCNPHGSFDRPAPV